MAKKTGDLNLDPLLDRSKNKITECIKCCTCCSKGGPALHKEDKTLLDEGKLHGRFLYTIRQGEPVEDNVKGDIIFAPTDIIKIKSRDGSEACLFGNYQKKECSIYESRPQECKILQCWDTKALEDFYEKDRLTRKDVLGHIEGLWDLIEEHQDKCSYEHISEILQKTPSPISGKAKEELLSIVAYDLEIRELVINQTDTDPNLIDFLFGRPLKQTLRRFGLEFGEKTPSQ